MKNNRKQIKVFQLFLCCVGLTLILSGCLNRIPTVDDIKNDLNNTEFIDASELYELYDGATKTIPVTEVLITDNEKEDKKCRLTCTVIQENENYKKETQLIVLYSKLDNWVLDTYSEINTSILPVSGVPDDILNRWSHLRYRSDNGSIELSDITHNFDATTLTDIVSWNCVVDRANCIKTMAIEKEFRFEKRYNFDDYAKWNYTAAYYQNEQVINREWKYDELEGSIWQGIEEFIGGSAIWTVRINSIDTINNTMDLDFYRNDVQSHDVRSYEIKDFKQKEPEQVLIMSSDYSYGADVKIYEDRLWYMAALNKINE